MDNLNFIEKLIILDGEYFWGGSTAQGIRMPLTKDSEYKWDGRRGCQGNGFYGVFFSNFGRYVYTDGEFKVECSKGILTLYSSENVTVGQTVEQTLKSAHNFVMKSVYGKSEIKVPEDLLLYPQFCTWTEMLTNVTEEKILAYAESIVESNLPHCLLIIDDGWMKDYGDWEFDANKFTNPKKMFNRLHDLGFKVEIWLVPFVNPNVPDVQLLLDNNALVRNQDGTPSLKTWWNCKSYVLDMTSPFANQWLTEKLDYLITEYGVDGFKLDAGDTDYYSYDDLTYKPTTPSEQCALWSEFAKKYEYSELRATFRHGFTQVITRLSDKQRNWSYECGIGALVPNMIQSGLIGYPFACADMIGGGVSADFDKEGSEKFDFELISRFCECSALMPCMQFSYAYWNRNEDIKSLFLKFCNLHVSVKDYLSKLIESAYNNFEPILRHLEYEFPHEGFKDVNYAFMLGKDYLVAPIVEKGVTTLTITLPKNATWTYCPTGQTYSGGQTVTVDAPIGTLPHFKRG